MTHATLSVQLKTLEEYGLVKRVQNEAMGCSHNQCTFCYMYADVRFSVCPMEQVEADIEEAARYCPDVERVFLEHGDAFVLSTDRLIQIADAIHARLPRVKTIAMYASMEHCTPSPAESCTGI